MEDEAPGAEVKATTERKRRPLWVRFVHYSIRQRRKRNAQKQPESAADKAARRTANATIAIAVPTLVLAVVSFYQWKEIHAGGVDTHNLAVAAGNQAIWTQKLSEHMQTQADRTKDLADRMKDQADSTKDLASSAKNQSETLRRQFVSSQEVIESQRAAITVSPYSIDHPMTFSGNNEMSFAFTLALVNNGAFAANDVRMRYKLYFSQFDKAIFTEPGKQQRKLCRTLIPPRIGNAPELRIYPGKGAPEQISGGWGFRESDVIPWPNDPEHPARLIPIVVGCVDYLSGAMPRWHQTGFIFEIRGKNRGIFPGSDIPPDALMMDRYIFDQGDSN